MLDIKNEPQFKCALSVSTAFPHVTSRQQLELFIICLTLFCHAEVAKPDQMSLVLSTHLYTLLSKSG